MSAEGSLQADRRSAARVAGPILTTARLSVRPFSIDDAPFVLELLNEPGWLRFIGDRGIRTVDGARDYLLRGPIAMYERHGFALHCVERIADGVPLGMCGLIKRATLDDIDLGFAFLARYWGHGYAREAISGVMDHARDVLGIARIVAIVAPDNTRSAAALRHAGFTFEHKIRMPGDEIDLDFYVQVAPGSTG
jgi:RimJ/RimL family protein N-acetyltransferase